MTMTSRGMTSLWLDNAAPIGSDEFVPDSDYDVVVAGAGLTGLVTGLLFARAGMRVAILEARTVGAVTTGNTTAKLSLLQGSQLSKVLPAKYYTGSPAARVLKDVFEACGEAAGAIDFPGTLDRWLRSQGPALEALRDLFDHPV